MRRAIVDVFLGSVIAALSLSPDARLIIIIINNNKKNNLGKHNE
jgi:hypothetical protein